MRAVCGWWSLSAVLAPQSWEAEAPYKLQLDANVFTCPRKEETALSLHVAQRHQLGQAGSMAGALRSACQSWRRSVGGLTHLLVALHSLPAWAGLGPRWRSLSVVMESLSVVLLYASCYNCVHMSSPGSCRYFEVSYPHVLAAQGHCKSTLVQRRYRVPVRIQYGCTPTHSNASVTFV